jgi:hypothetical protein
VDAPRSEIDHEECVVRDQPAPSTDFGGKEIGPRDHSPVGPEKRLDRSNKLLGRRVDLEPQLITRSRLQRGRPRPSGGTLRRRTFAPTARRGPRCTELRPHRVGATTSKSIECPSAHKQVIVRQPSVIDAIVIDQHDVPDRPRAPIAATNRDHYGRAVASSPEGRWPPPRRRSRAAAYSQALSEICWRRCPDRCRLSRRDGTQFTGNLDEAIPAPPTFRVRTWLSAD